MKTVIIVQARMSSTRLPGKVLKTVLGKPLLEFQWERLKKVSRTDQVVIATSTNRADDAIADFCRTRGIDCYRGSEADVLSRYYEAATKYGAETVVRVTADCPLIDPEVIDEAIAQFENYGDDRCNYLSNTLERSYPRGLDCEVFSYDALEAAHVVAKQLPEREHVTPYIYRNPHIFRLQSLEYDTDESAHRWTVDTEQDFDLVKMMLEALYPVTPDFRLDDCLDLLERHPAWSEMNSKVVQKTV